MADGPGNSGTSRSIHPTLEMASTRTMPWSLIPPSDAHETSDDLSDYDDAAVSHISDEDAESLIGPAMSRIATRLKSPKTPAAEKTSALEEAGGYFDSDPETPPATDGLEGADLDGEPSSHETTRGEDVLHKDVVAPIPSQKPKLSLGSLPPPGFDKEDLPISPWHAGPKPFVVERSDPPQSSLSSVFGAGTERKRSLSNGADALRKLIPKGLPSMASVGNLFGSPNTHQKSRLSPSFPRESSHMSSSRSTNSSVSGGSPPSLSPRPCQLESLVGAQRAQSKRPSSIRRVTSDDSLLYHSLSRASSLGDDSRFENHRDQVNSRVKAIRDSIQDRSSFRMPNLPNLPSMPRVPNFSFNMNFLNGNNVPVRWKPETDEEPDILPGNITREKINATPNPAVGSGMVGAATESARPITEGPNTNVLDRAMENLVGDIVIMGGYRGSILRSTKNNRQVWVPVKVGLNIRKVDLEVGLEPEDEEMMEEKIYPSGMLQNIGPVDISKRLFKRLHDCENAKNGKLRIWDYGYDWRLSPHLLSKKLEAFLEKLPSNCASEDGTRNRQGGALVIAHSLGGLITRHVVNRRPELFAGVIYAGVPQSCINILGPLRNGDAVLLSQRVLTAQVNFTLRTSFVLLPEDGSCFVDINTKEKYSVDFFSLDDWIKYRFSPCTDPPLPPKAQPSGALGSILNLSGSLLSLPIPGKKSISGTASPPASNSNTDVTNKDTDSQQQGNSRTTRAADAIRKAEGGTDRTLAPQMGNNTKPVNKGQVTNTSVSTAVTLPRDKAITYLRRTLAETKKFKQELHFRPELEAKNSYPPLAIIYGKSIPTCCGAKVDGIDSIPCADVYDNLAFASGDGVCLAKEAMLPEGYKAAYGGRIRSDRGHVTLLGDLNAVGRAIYAVSKGRGKGIGLGLE